MSDTPRTDSQFLDDDGRRLVGEFEDAVALCRYLEREIGVREMVNKDLRAEMSKIRRGVESLWHDVIEAPPGRDFHRGYNQALYEALALFDSGSSRRKGAAKGVTP